MTPEIEQFRRAAHRALEWIVGYYQDPRRYLVRVPMKPGALADALPGEAPEEGESYEALLEDFERLIVPAATHWNHPRFFAWFPSSSSPPAVLGEMLAATLNTNGIHWLSSPAVVELEQVTLGWLRQWLGLPREFFGEILDTASVSSLHAMAAAREAADPEVRERGARPGLTLYCSEHAHSSIEKGALVLGIGRQHIRKIPVDGEFRMRADLLERAIEQDRAAGLRPFCIVATAGTTSTSSVDPLEATARIAEGHGLWLHVDAAYAGAAAILPEKRPLFEGWERAHSIVLNAHKWLFTPLDLSVLYTRRPDVMRRTFSLVPEYLRTAEDPRAVHLMDYGLPLGRRFRALKFWFVLRRLGRRGITELLRSHIAWAQELAAWIDADRRFERVAPVPFSTVCFRLRGDNDANRRLLNRVNESGRFLLSHTELDGRYVLRIAIGNYHTRREDVQEAWELIRRTADEL
ncbi:MAG: pyridoxal-dependent decarboxylase [Bryobacterales bacterium]|nr:pyridoxal-dependent decarboxylase [Bryobacteraceae bacterium]MDW8131857.1 pyridoxal-dependent decarboxylase [Bryobacterales bacterium]